MRQAYCVQTLAVRHLHDQVFPAQRINEQPFDLGRVILAHGHHHRAAPPGLTDAAPLQVARETDRRTLRPLLVFMRMTQRPVVVSLGVQLLKRTRRVVRMPAVAALQRGMQHTYVEVAAALGDIEAQRSYFNIGVLHTALQG